MPMHAQLLRLFVITHTYQEASNWLYHNTSHGGASFILNNSMLSLGCHVRTTRLITACLCRAATTERAVSLVILATRLVPSSPVATSPAAGALWYPDRSRIRKFRNAPRAGTNASRP